MRLLRRLIRGFFTAVGVLTVTAIIVGALTAAWYARGGGADLPARMLLTLDLREDLPEAPPSGGLSSVLGGGRRSLTVSDLVLALDAAGRDPAVGGLLARVDGTR